MTNGNIHLYRSLTPLALLYRMGVSFRNKLFDWGILRSEEFDIPLICVGNITVGGTGKTPHIEYLIRLLSDKYRVAVISRGYKRKSKGFILADASSTVAEIGDETLQMKQKFPHVTFAVDANRRRGISRLMQLKPAIEVILMDDAFQHRYVAPGYSILLTDYNRLIIDDCLLPVGRLREPLSAKNRADSVIITKCPFNLQAMDIRILIKQLDLYPYQQLYFSCIEYSDIHPVFPEVADNRSLTENKKNNPILIVTGIASPRPMVQHIAQFTAKPEQLHFSDHHNFTKDDIRKIKEKFQQLKGESPFILVTEKDATRLKHHPDMDEELKKKIYCLPMQIDFLQNQTELFNAKILDYVRKNKRNSIVSQSKSTGNS